MVKNDIISRQAAIDALVKWTHLTWEHLKIIYPMLNVLEKLPSAEPERPFEIQDILDYLDTTLHPIISPEYWNVYSELHDMISTLSVAQPEIIRCKDYKHYQFADNRALGMPVKICEWFGFKDVDDDDFCSRAERKTNE